MEIDILSLFPGYFAGPFDESILKRAREKGIVQIRLHDIRSFAHDKHKRVDDRPYGGGPGMVLMPEPTLRAIDSLRREGTYVIYLSPQGPLLNAKKCHELKKRAHLVLLCGHYEGIDERILSSVDEEISVGDFVLTNGCIAAIALVDGVVRLLPGVLGHEEAPCLDSFEGEGFFDYPHYTRPRIFEGQEVPEVLCGGDHAAIACWRQEKALEKTLKVRPDLLKEKVYK